VGKIVLLRHGESIYNQKNLFTGWSDVELSPKGVKEAKRAGEILKSNGILFDICFSSWLKRAIHTAQIALGVMGWEHIDFIKSWKLNERHYGAWQGKNKDEVKSEIGEEAFLAIRRGYDTPPPPLGDDEFNLFKKDLKFSKIDTSLLPRAESLKDTRKRVLNYFYEAIAKELAEDKTILLSAHGNSLRALIMFIENLAPKEIVKVEIPTGEPILYTFDDELKMVKKSNLK